MFRYGTFQSDFLSGSSISDVLVGSIGSDFINGRAGSDWLHGGWGLDFLYGGDGSDAFVFSVQSPFYWASRQKVDHIIDFTPGKDHIVIGDIFLTRDVEDFDDGAFAVGRTAQDADDRVLYDPGSGLVSYDMDGQGGRSAVRLAKLDKHLELSADDFLFTV